MSLITFTSKGLYCPLGDFYIDPWSPVARAVITHGHGDHAKWGMKHYLCHTYTKAILQKRIAEDISVETLDYSDTKYINGVKLSMHPAGHIIGSAQIRLEHHNFVSVVSGDYKIVNDQLSTPFELVKCNEFVTESTFGLPIYNWLSNDEIFSELRNWVIANQSDNKTSIFIAYSLGKAQRLMKALQGLAPLYVHGAIARLNEAIESSGITLPVANTWNSATDKNDLRGNIVILPPSLLGTNVIKKIPNGAIAICSGWMQVRGSRRWQSADAGFAISDHADWNGLLQTVHHTGAQKIYVTHGYTSAFSRYLAEKGLDAQEVHTHYGNEDENEQERTEVILKQEGI